MDALRTSRTGNTAAKLSLIVLATVFSTSWSAAAEIRLRATATASGPIVLLSDVAEIVSADRNEAATLGLIELAPAPAAGGETRIDQSVVRTRLAARGVNLAATKLSGSSLVRVGGPAAPAAVAVHTTDERTLQAQQKRAEKLIETAVESHLTRIDAKLGKVVLEVRLSRDDVPMVLDGASVGFELAGGKAPWNEWQRMLVRTLGKNNEVREAIFECRVMPYPYVLAARQTVPRGQVIQPADLVWRQTDNLDGAFERAAELIGQETQRTIRADEIVRRGDVRSVPLVRSGDIVTVFSRRGGIVVKGTMKARSDGAAGETVSLATLDGRQTIVARVSGYHQAEVGAQESREPQTPGDGDGLRLLQGVQDEATDQGVRGIPTVLDERPSVSRAMTRARLDP